MGVSINGGTPQKMDGLVQGKSHLEMDDDWGYPYSRKPPWSNPKKKIGKSVKPERYFPWHLPHISSVFHFSGVSIYDWGGVLDPQRIQRLLSMFQIISLDKIRNFATKNSIHPSCSIDHPFAFANCFTLVGGLEIKFILTYISWGPSSQLTRFFISFSGGCWNHQPELNFHVRRQFIPEWFCCLAYHFSAF